MPSNYFSLSQCISVAVREIDLLIAKMSGLSDETSTIKLALWSYMPISTMSTDGFDFSEPEPVPTEDKHSEEEVLTQTSEESPPGKPLPLCKAGLQRFTESYPFIPTIREGVQPADSSRCH